jgi:hypothetical protein
MRTRNSQRSSQNSAEPSAPSAPDLAMAPAIREEMAPMPNKMSTAYGSAVSFPVRNPRQGMVRHLPTIINQITREEGMTYSSDEPEPEPEPKLPVSRKPTKANKTETRSTQDEEMDDPEPESAAKQQRQHQPVAATKPNTTGRPSTRALTPTVEEPLRTRVGKPCPPSTTCNFSVSTRNISN